MKPWHQVVVPHIDIRKGEFDESVFAADLSDVIADRGPLEYRDAETFFRKTYPTKGLLDLLSAIVGRLSGSSKGQAVIQIRTPFGGGKTHSLIALYHLLKSGPELKASEAVGEILKKAGLTRVPQARLVAFVGTAADPLKGRTPWGEIAYQLGKYETVKEHDVKRRSPGKDILHSLLGNQPTLILMDEIAEYSVKAKDYRDQIVAFFQELTETVKVLPRCALVVTLPSSAPYGEDGERALHQLEEIFKRVESIRTPVEGDEIYEVIRRRLFEDPGDPEEARKTAENFLEMYTRLGDDVPADVRDLTYRNGMRKAYPFHPELIDILFERWSTFPNFQRTRGVLRLLAQIVSDLYNRQHPAPLIQPAHVNLENQAIRAEFLRHIGNEYEGVIASDIAGPNAKAKKIDKELGSEYARFGVASGLATAIFFGSFSGAEKRGVGIQRLRVAILREGIPPAIVGDALGRLEDALWYLHVERGVYSFSSQPNLNRVIIEKEEAVKPEQIDKEVEDYIRSRAGSELKVWVWPRVSQDVPDTKDLKLAILSLEHFKGAPDTEAFAKELLDKCGQKFRTYRNTLLLLAADSGELISARQQVKRWLAYRAIHDDKEMMRKLSDENKKALESKLRDAQSSLTHQILCAYRHVAKADEKGVAWFDMGLPTVGERLSFAARVREYLKSEDILLSQIAPKLVASKTLKEDEKEKLVEEIRDAFLKYPNMPMLENESVLANAIVEGVRKGEFGLRVGDRVYFKESLQAADVGTGVVVVRAQSVVQEAGKALGTASPAPTPTVEVSKQGPASPQPGLIRSYRLSAKIGWDKMSDFFRGVIMPLRQNGAQMEVRVILRAECQDGLKKDTLDRSVRETLRQINAEIEEESES